MIRHVSVPDKEELGRMSQRLEVIQVRALVDIADQLKDLNDGIDSICTNLQDLIIEIRRSRA